MIILSCVLATACAPTIQGAAKQASRAAVDESVKQMTSEETKQDLQEAAHDPKVESATKEITDQISEGLLESLSSEQAQTQLADLTRLLSRTAAEQFVTSLGAPRSRSQLETLTRGVTQAMLAQVALSLQADLGPALGAVMKDDIVPGMSQVIEADLQPTLGRSAQLVAYQAVLGANKGIDEAFLGNGQLLGSMRDASYAVPQWLWLGMGVMGLLALIVMSGAVMAIMRARTARLEVQRLENATLLLATAMSDQPLSGNSGELLAVVQQALARRSNGPLRT